MVTTGVRCREFAGLHANRLLPAQHVVHIQDVWDGAQIKPYPKGKRGRNVPHNDRHTPTPLVVPEPHNPTTCRLCAGKLVKNGRHPSGTQRWRCKDYGASSLRKRPDVSRRHQLTLFVTWLLGKHSQTEKTGNAALARQFRRDTAWCWGVQPSIGPVTTTHHSILVDGIWIGSWCLRIAVTDRLQVLAWQWSARESTAAWTALFAHLPAPAVVVCDGGSGIAAALRNQWPQTRMQRCILHVQMNVRQHLTLRPRTTAGKRLLALSRQLSQVATIEDAIAWQQNLNRWWQAHGFLTRERTLFRKGQWGFTHDRLRKAWLLLRKLARQDVLFTYLLYGNPRTTSALEVGINNGIRTVLRSHRGMTEPHMKRAAEWFLSRKEIPLERVHEFITPPSQTASIGVPESTEVEHGPSLYDNGIDASEGLWVRSGWAGRG